MNPDSVDAVPAPSERAVEGGVESHLPTTSTADAIRAAVLARNLAAGTGLVPIKSEYLRAPPEATGAPRLRGQNKDREFVVVERSGARPTFEGEANFLFGPALGRIKAAMKSAAWQPKRPLEEQHQKRETDEKLGAPQCDVGKSDDPVLLERPNVTSLPVRRSDEPPEERRERLFRNKLILAPLTTVGNLPFRRICKQFGADVTVGEMAMTHNLNHTQQSEWSLLRRHSSEDIFGIQVACPRGVDAKKFATLLEASEFEYDFLDVNCGCPVDLIIRYGCGCGLWERKGRMREVVQNLVAHQGKPVTVKCRVGPDEEDPRLHAVIGEYESWGADAVTVHGRSRKQRYTKLANWSYIEECAKLTALPLIGNGDLFTLESVEERRAVAPHVASHMFARGALIKPWIFTEVKERRVWDISSSERFEMLRTYANFGLAHWGADEKGVASTRRFLLEWQSFLCRYVPVGLLEQQPQYMNDRPPCYVGRDELETLMASDQVSDWITLSEMILGPAGPNFKFVPKHKSNSYRSGGEGSTGALDEFIEGQG